MIAFAAFVIIVLTIAAICWNEYKLHQERSHNWDEIPNGGDN